MLYPKRTHTCGELRESHIGTTVTLNGWVASRRDLGPLLFLDLRDRYGVTQLVCEQTAGTPAAMLEVAKTVRGEFVVAATGVVRARTNPNPRMETGRVELVVHAFEIINTADTPPFEILDDTTASEEQRLTYRYLDLRRAVLQRNFLIRNEVYQTVHRYFHEHNFVEIETPVLMKSTPEGARDFLVPSRLHAGKFYALPQSPQIYKQLLMVSGFDRYVQIVKCFRDEDLRADRQPEFSQIDVEMSFVDEADVLAIAEGFMVRLWREVCGREAAVPFPRMTWHEAMRRFGSDKPDTRFGIELVDLNTAAANTGFKVFSDAVASGGHIGAIVAEGCGSYSRKELDVLTDHAKRHGAKGLVWLRVAGGACDGPSAKFLTIEQQQGIVATAGAADGDLLLIVADAWERACTVLGQLRLEIARRTGVLDGVRDTDAFLFVVDFPLLEYSAEEGRYAARHHPFTSPKVEDIPLFDTDPAAMRANAYDLVVNGVEMGGGSIRIHRRDIQEKMFSALGFSREEYEHKFGFLLNAFRYGPPPHGGIAFGLDRLVMTLAGTENIRDVIAFPKTTSMYSLMDDAPSSISEAQLRELKLKLDGGSSA